MYSISFAGTAKNTGKTTTCLQVINEGRAAGLSIGLTSIGYDGELKDQVTGLPKPRFFLQKDDWVATAHKCLQASSASFSTLINTHIQTSLGPIILACVSTPGWAVLAGPNRRSDLTKVLERFSSLHIDLALADGALNRMVPMLATQGLVLATGASFTTDIMVVADHAGAIARLFNLPTLPAAANTNHTYTWEEGSLLSERAAQHFLNSAPHGLRQINILNACRPELLKNILEARPDLQQARFIFGSPLKLIASGDPRDWERLFETYPIQPAYQENLLLRLITVNPFYPQYLPKSGSYQPAQVEASGLLHAVQAAAPQQPVLDLFQSRTSILDYLLTPSEISLVDGKHVS
jgi:hypothetical protein